MRYIGGKSNLLQDIGGLISHFTDGIHRIIDIFSGSGVVASYFKSLGYEVVGNDMLYFAYVLSRGSTALNSMPTFRKLGIVAPLAYLNDLTFEGSGFRQEDCFIYQNYSPHDGVSRMYFQPDNAIKIDIIRLTIEEWKKACLIDENEYFYLLASLIAAVPYVSNITGVYGAYLKHWDKRAYNLLKLVSPNICDRGSATFHNQNCDLLLPTVAADLLYADPPYNSRQYLPNYHVLETIARYDRPKIHGITGMRDYGKAERSAFCTRNGVESAFRRMIQNANVRYVVISYNSEGLLSQEQLSSICQEFAIKNSFQCRDIEYRRYNNVGTKTGKVRELLFFFEKQYK